MPSPGFLGDVTFEYQVCLPAPNTNVCDTATVTLTFVELPDMPTIDLNCNDNGLTDIVVTAPIGPEFEYSINGGTYQSSPTFTGLAEGTYQIKVRNSFSGCENTNATAVVIDDLDIVIPIDVTDVLCKDDTSGEINITVTGGKPPYTYSWSNGATTQDLTDLAAGTYTIIVTDDYGCTITRNVIVTEPQSTLITSGDVTDALCNGDDSGAIDFTANGGTPPYTYAWSNGETTEDLSDVVAGNYTVTVTDANGCTTTCEITLDSTCTKYDYYNIFSRNSEFDFEMFPNPTKGRLTVKPNKLSDNNATVELYDLIGTKIFSQSFSKIKDNEININLSGLASQVYYLKVITKDGTKIKKVVLDK